MVSLTLHLLVQLRPGCWFDNADLRWAVGLPIEGIGLIIGVDRVLDMLCTVVNVTKMARWRLLSLTRKGSQTKKHCAIQVPGRCPIPSGTQRSNVKVAVTLVPTWLLAA